MRKNKATHNEIREQTTELLLQWKEIILAKSAPLKRPPTTDVEGGMGARTSTDKYDKAIAQVNGTLTLNSTPSRKRPHEATSEATTVSSGDFERLRQRFLTGDAIRDKCHQMLIAAITVDRAAGEEPDEPILSLCRSIEECLFNHCNQSTTTTYKSQFRSKYLNLKDSNNRPLRHALLTSTLSADRFIAMTPAEMASEERRRQDAELAERNLREAKAVQDNEAETDQFRCGRCSQRKTKYYQLQTRSADEPMTTFVTCINCGHRWKFC